LAAAAVEVADAADVLAKDPLLAPNKRMPPWLAKKDPKTNDVMAESLMRMLIEGPDVSFSGSPTVSPQTAALWVSSPFLNLYFPFSSTSSPAKF